MLRGLQIGYPKGLAKTDFEKRKFVIGLGLLDHFLYRLRVYEIDP